jgi:hypothetical protein
MFMIDMLADNCTGMVLETDIISRNCCNPSYQSSVGTDSSWFSEKLVMGFEPATG